jgi:hypothetical protein
MGVYYYGTSWLSLAWDLIKQIVGVIMGQCKYCRKTDENDLFVELDNNKQVEYWKRLTFFLS